MGKLAKSRVSRARGDAGATPRSGTAPARARSLGSLLVLQEKLWLPAVRSLMLQVLCKTACFKGGILGEAALQVWQRWQVLCGAPEVLVVPKPTP